MKWPATAEYYFAKACGIEIARTKLIKDEGNIQEEIRREPYEVG
jgi:hypothetical protein